VANVLLYNLNGEKGRKIKLVLLRMGVRARSVLPSEYGYPIGCLAGIRDFPTPEAPASGTAFADEMIVMNGFSSAQLDSFLAGLRAARVPRVALKAIVTEHNAPWDSYTLYRELSREHEAMKNAGPKKSAPVHEGGSGQDPAT